MKAPIDFFTEIEDPWIDKRKEHLLEDIPLITIAAEICGTETWNGMEKYGKTKLKLSGCIVTIDVMGCQTEIAEKNHWLFSNFAYILF